MTDDTLTNTLQRAIALHHAGQLQEAQALYLTILQVYPEHPDTHHNMGILAMQLGQTAIGINHFKHALTADPTQGKFWHSTIQALIETDHYVEARQVLEQGKMQVGLQGQAIDELNKKLSAPSPAEIQLLLANVNQGQYLEAERNARVLIACFPDHGFGWKVLALVLQQLRLPEALSAMRKAAELLPDDAETQINFAAALHERGLLSEAIDSYRHVLQISPGNAKAYSNLGIIFHNLGLYTEAESCLAKTVELMPNAIDALLNLGLTVQAQGRSIDAEQYFRRAITLDSTIAQSYHYLSIALKIQGQVAEAEISCRQALELNPHFAEAYGNLGAIRFDQGLFSEAETCFANALISKPDYPEAHNNLGTVQQIQRHLLKAEASYRQAIALNPNYAEAHTNLGINLQAQGRVEEAGHCWQTSLRLNPNQIATQSGLVFHLNYSARLPHSPYLEEARKYGQMIDGKVIRRFTDWQCERQPKRLRVGLVSGDFRNHPVGHFLHGLLRQINTTKIDLVAYATQPGTDDFSALIQPYFADWKNIDRLSNEDAAQLIHDDGIHILFDISGHSSHNRLSLFAWKPAPIQVSWLGYLASTGVEAIDYVLSDQYSLLPEDEQNFTESIWRMPGSCICFTPTNQSIAVGPLPAITQGFITFGSFNNLTKMGDSVVALWSQVLHSVPGSRLFLKASQLNDPVIRARTLERFAAHGITADRLTLAETIPNADEHLATYHKIDIALDTFPYPGVTTSVEALWMGIPVITLRGDGILARAGESININVELADWIAADETDYINKAVNVAGDLTKLAQLREQLRSTALMSPLFDSACFAKHFADAVWAMWQQRNSQQ